VRDTTWVLSRTSGSADDHRVQFAALSPEFVSTRTERKHMQTSFADGILNIAITGPLIRIDFGTATPVTNAEGKQEVQLTPTQQLVMPLEGFIRSFGLQEQIVRKLIADGVIKVQAPTPPSDLINTSGLTQ